MITKNYSLLAAAVAATLSAGCAEVQIKKIPSPTQYMKWTDKMQAESDGVEGIRFYLPRPYINVFESFPVHSDVYLARGKVTPDGRYITIDKLVEVRPDGKGGVIYADEPIQVSARSVYRPDAATAKALSEAAAKLAKPQSETDEKPATTEPPKNEDKTKDGKTGQSNLKVTNDNSAFAFQPLRGNFDIVYMPDFEEQYAVVKKARLGNASVTVNTGQGWSLQGLDAQVDNSAIVDRVFKLIDTATQLGTEAAKAALGIPPGTTALAQPQSESESVEKDKLVPGTEITMKVTVVHYAAKGLYPVLKPRELQPRKIEGDASYQIIADLGSASTAPQSVQTNWGRFTVPQYPYQHVSFNTFRFMAIEGMHPDAPFGHLIDKTGTGGDAGDRRGADVAKAIGAAAQSANEAAKRQIEASILGPVQNDLKGAINQALERSADANVRSMRADSVTIAPRDDVVDLEVTLAAKPAAGSEGAVRTAIEQAAKKRIEAAATQLQGRGLGSVTLKP